MRALGGILLLAGGLLAGEAHGPVLPCPQVREAPRVDGVLDDPAWKLVPAHAVRGADHVHPNYRERWSGDADLSADVSAVVTREDLYLGITVRDDVTMHEVGRAWWVGDAIEVFFDRDLSSGEDDQRYSSDDLQLFLMPFHEGQRWGVVARGPDLPYPDGGLRGLSLAATRTPDGYVLEARIPLWNLAPLRTDAEGCIGFDLAFDDVDEPGVPQTQSYMTLSGRFDLFSTPANFARLAIGPRTAEADAEDEAPAPLIDWGGLLLGLVGVILLTLAARRMVRTIARRTRVGTATLCAIFVGAAALVALLPWAARSLDDRTARAEWAEPLALVQAAATSTLDLDEGDGDARADRLLALLHDGQVRIHPRYAYTCLPTTPRARAGPATAHAPGPHRYGIGLEPGETRVFPLDALPAPARLRLDLDVPRGDRMAGTAAAEVSVAFRDGPPVEAHVARTDPPQVLLDLPGRGGAQLRSLTVRNRLPSQVLTVNGLYREQEGAWAALPLAFRARAGVPFDVWEGRPQTHLLTVPAGSAAVVPGAGAAGDHLWLAIGCEGAYPDTPHGVDAAVVRVVYAGGVPGPELRLVNGRDLQSRLIAYARVTGDPESVALQWEDGLRQPVLYSLHGLDLDPARVIEQVEVTNLGVVSSLTVAAVTLGKRTSESPAAASGLKLEQDRLLLRDEARLRLQGLGFSVRAPSGTTGSTGPATGVAVPFELSFGDGETGGLEVRLPRGQWAATILGHLPLVFGLAALFLAFAAVVAGTSLLHRATRLRRKMLVAVGAATVVPLLFLVVSLMRVLNERAEHDLEGATRNDLSRMEERIAARKVRARELALAARDALALVPAGREATLRQQARSSRAEVEAQGGFLRLPEIDLPGTSPLGNVSLVDAVTRSGLYYSPWDGLLALGVARGTGRQRCLVGLPAAQLLAGTLDEDVTAALFGPGGEPLAVTGGPPGTLRSGPARRRTVARIEQAQRTGQPVYEAATTLRGHSVAAAHIPLREGGRLVGLLGIYRSRTATEEAKTSILRTLLLSTLAALLLVAIAGTALVDQVTRRLQRVTRAAGAIAAGDLSSRAPVEAGDEVTQLAVSFNTMAQSLDARVQQLTDLQRGLTELTAVLDPAEVARAAATLLERATHAPHVQVATLDAATDRLEPLHRSGEGAPLGHRLPESGPLRDAVDLRRAVAREGAVFLPLMAGDRVVGIAVCSPAGEVDPAFLDATGRQIGIALDNARLYHAAVTDEGTGLYTRAFLVRRLKEEVDRGAATGRPVSLLRIVLDDFGSVALRHGPALASRLLAEAAGVVDRVLPRRNMLARGDAGELLALLVESDAPAARRHMDRLAAALQRHDFAALGEAAAPTFTWRTVSYPRDGAAADILLDSLFEPAGAWEEAAADTAGPALKVPPQLGIVLGRSATMRAALEVVARVAPTNATILLSGETGTGKEVIADLIHANSGRRNHAFVKVNCAAIPETLLEAELFGHERGAFTGADRRRIGRFELAHRGTLFLDEIGDLPLSMQVKLLRILQERRITRVGGTQALDVDVRILAASNRDLGEEVRQGRFREDLYHRLHVVELRLPPLRERREDVPDLIEHFRLEFNQRHGLRVEAFAPDALDGLYRYDWPGNVRELRNVVERSMLLAGGRTVERSHVTLPAAGVREESPAPLPHIEGLTPRQERILRQAREQGGVTNGEIVRQESVSPRTALREVQRLVDRGLLVRVGRRRGAVYKVAF